MWAAEGKAPAAAGTLRESVSLLVWRCAGRMLPVSAGGTGTRPAQGPYARIAGRAGWLSPAQGPFKLPPNREGRINRASQRDSSGKVSHVDGLVLVRIMMVYLVTPSICAGSGVPRYSGSVKRAL